MAVAVRELPDLFKGDQCWKIRVEDLGAERGVFIVREFRPTVWKTRVEDTPGLALAWDAAVVRSEELWESQRSRGYEVRTMDDSKIFPMLAHEYTKHANKLSDAVCVQPKIDGIRLLVGRVSDAELKAYSRTGKRLVVPHILRALAPILGRAEFVDGELFAPSLTFEELSGLVRTQTAEGKDLLEYHIFDCFKIDEKKGAPSDQGFWDRFSILKERLIASEGDVIKLVPTERRPKADVPKLLEEYVQEGHEGVMIRSLVAPYVLGKRTFSLQKLKPFKTEAFEIVGAESGAGKDRGCVTWQCRTSDGIPFKKAVEEWDSAALRLLRGTVEEGMAFRESSKIASGIPEVVTVTFLVHCDSGAIDIKLLHENLKDMAGMSTSESGIEIALNTNDARFGTTGGRRIVNNSFYNQVSLTARKRGGRQINCKVFAKGCLLVTGCRTMRELDEILRGITKILKRACPSIGDLRIARAEATMINASVALTGPERCMTVMPYAFLRCVTEMVECRRLTGRVTVEYNPTVYSGIKLKVDRGTALIFTTGKIILTGCKTLDEVLGLWRTVLKIVTQNVDKEVVIFSDHARKVRKDVKQKKRQRAVGDSNSPSLKINVR
ncbi:DNA ligase [Klebsormidium nitens]|uniref:DNA ligase n=1 Tax=Klebsormidium nitens TaxID=105231 RepID=A0A1Y1IRW3_KLENI|nr:DNA ligase [Klebsormidium nitens]|eukprot:GAQ91486.1 DNA ligase [Klebsormidium nitens]